MKRLKAILDIYRKQSYAQISIKIVGWAPMQKQLRVFGYIPSYPKNLIAYVYASVCKEGQAHKPTEIIGS